jgi:esterase/lipase
MGYQQTQIQESTKLRPRGLKKNKPRRQEELDEMLDEVDDRYMKNIRSLQNQISQMVEVMDISMVTKGLSEQAKLQEIA